VIARDHGAAEHDTAGDTERRSEQYDDRDQLKIVQDERSVGKAESLESGDLLALRHHLPTERDIEQECRNAEKDEGNGDRRHLLLVEFVLKKPIGRLVASFDCADRTIGLKQPVEFGDDRLRIGTRRQRNDEVIEGPFHIESAFRRAAVDPQNRKKAVIGE
jgi:hypothetical protein